MWVKEMDLYYQNETLYIDIMDSLDHDEYEKLQAKVLRIIEDYGVERIVIQNHNPIFYNRHFIRQMKQDFYQRYPGEFLIK